MESDGCWERLESGSFVVFRLCDVGESKTFSPTSAPVYASFIKNSELLLAMLLSLETSCSSWKASKKFKPDSSFSLLSAIESSSSFPDTSESPRIFLVLGAVLRCGGTVLPELAAMVIVTP